MPSKRFWIIWWAVVLACFVLLVLTPPKGRADPGGVCGSAGCVHFCPDTGGFVSTYSGACPSLRVGPYAPGGLRPNDDDDDD
jgi:hypothetical protein